MRVVLRSDLDKVGKRGDIVEVADGYARNYLLPKGHAIVATAGVTAQANAMRRSRDLRDAKDREAAELVARKLVPMVIRIPARAGSGSSAKLFGSITSSDIAEAVAEQANITLDRRRLHLDEPIKSLGTHEVPVKLHSDVEFRVTVEV
ncbi:MAG TPA: 50S ribosomal protein L9, partial [Acidimicrobiales bacterium]|nr:50S ribosomal protein L9 [Acidimicrobiales bacterium]